MIMSIVALIIYVCALVYVTVKEWKRTGRIEPYQHIPGISVRFWGRNGGELRHMLLCINNQDAATFSLATRP